MEFQDSCDYITRLVGHTDGLILVIHAPSALLPVTCQVGNDQLRDSSRPIRDEVFHVPLCLPLDWMTCRKMRLRHIICGIPGGFQFPCLKILEIQIQSTVSFAESNAPWHRGQFRHSVGFALTLRIHDWSNISDVHWMGLQE